MNQKYIYAAVAGAAIYFLFFRGTSQAAPDQGAINTQNFDLSTGGNDGNWNLDNIFD